MHLLQTVLLVASVILDARILGYTVRNNPNVDPVICESYEHGTKIPNPVDCSSFYVCDRGYPEHVQCTEGLYFDVNLKVCNWPESVTCVHGSLPHKKPDDFSHGIINANNPEKPIEISPAEVVTEIHDISSKNDYKPNPFPSINIGVQPQNPSDNSMPIDSGIIPGNSAEDISSLENNGQIGGQHQPGMPSPGHPGMSNGFPIIGSELDSSEKNLIQYPFIGGKIDSSGKVECTQDGLYYLPHPRKCEYYYLCISRVANENFCGEKLHWDYLKQRCDLASLAMCYLKMAEMSRPSISDIWRPQPISSTAFPNIEIIYSTSSSKIIQMFTTPSPTPITYIPTTRSPSTVKVEQVVNVKPKPPTVLIPEADLTAVPPPPNPLDGFDPEHVRCVHEGIYFLPHPTDCGIYFICLNHTLNIHRCGHNTQWDYIYNQCTVPDPNRCYVSRNGTIHGTGSSQFEDSPANPMEGYDAEHIRCIHPGFYFLPHPTNCRRYFVCSHNTLSIYQCTAESTWDYKEQQCSSANNKCYYEEELSNHHEVTTATEKEHDLSELLSGYDPDLVRCLHDGVYYLPHPTRCQFYFMCAYHTLTLHECHNPMVWNYGYERCDLPDRSKCFDVSIYRTTQTTQQESTTMSTTTTAAPKTAPIMTTTKKTTTPTTTTSPTTTTTTTTTTSKPTTTIGVHMPMEVEQPDINKDNGEDLDVLPKCPRHQAFYPHSKDCRKYYICIGGVPILTKCPENLYWDTQQRMCSLPSHTKCTLGRRA